MTKLILDASVAISWTEESDEFLLPELASKLQNQLIITPTVRNELEEGEMSENLEKLIETSEEETVEAEMIEDYYNRYPRLGRGEISVILLAETLEEEDMEYYAILDEKRARTIADRKNINYKGTIGILNDCIVEGLMKEDRASEIIEEMKKNGSRFPEKHRKLLETD